MSSWLDRRQRTVRGGGAPGRQRPYRPALESLEDRYLLAAGYTQVNLASDVPGLARVTDPNLVSPWGISFSPTGPFWVAEAGTGVSDLLDGRGQRVPLAVTVPPPAGSAGAPAGTVYNAGSGFVLAEDGRSQASLFLFASLNGTISAWVPALNPTRALVVLDNASAGAVYTGLALATDPTGHSFLYAADVSHGRIDVFDQHFQPVTRGGAFQDPTLPPGFVPFNVTNIDNKLFVTYAPRQGADGVGRGFVDVYDPAGDLVRRLASRGPLDAPWGLALAPADFGPFGGALLVGNNGDGHISAYDPRNGAFLGQLADDGGKPVALPGLWALTFGNGHEGGDASTLFFTAGLDDGRHGLFGAFQGRQKRGADTAGRGSFDPHAPGERADYPLPPTQGPAFQDDGADQPPPSAALLPLTESSLVLVPTLTIIPQASPQGNVRVAAAPAVVASFNRGAVMGLVSSGTALLVSGVEEPRLPRDTEGDYRLLGTFLDLNALEDSPETAGTGHGRATDRTAAGREAGTAPAGGSAVAIRDVQRNAAQPSEAFPSSVPADQVFNPESAAAWAPENEVVATPDSGKWAIPFQSLLLAVSISAVWGGLRVCRGRSQLVLGAHAHRGLRPPAPTRVLAR
jgi:uncharacterized protein (TIGR03118 family)